jgi:hypothetical protein
MRQRALVKRPWLLGPGRNRQSKDRSGNQNNAHGLASWLLFTREN